MKQLWIGGAVLAFGLTFSGMALADAIDGDWCSDGETRTMTINGPRILTPGRQEADGNYSRHAFSYVVPKGEADEGLAVEMMLLNETQVLVSVGGAEGEMWHRCDLSS